MAAWLALQAPGRGGDGERVLGVEWRARMCSVWAEGRDAPWRAACGVRARVRALVCAWRVDSHPWLGERVTTQLAWSPGGTRP